MVALVETRNVPARCRYHALILTGHVIDVHGLCLSVIPVSVRPLQAPRIVAPRRRTSSYDQQDFPCTFPRYASTRKSETFPDVGSPFACSIEPRIYRGSRESKWYM